MATPFNLAQIANQESFRMRVDYYMQKGAIAVLAESGGTAGHAERAAYADTVVEGTASVKRHALAALTNATVAAVGDLGIPAEGGFGISDNDLEFAVNEMWNGMSKYESGGA